MQSMPAELSQTQSYMVNAFIRSVYNWMAMGLALTGFIAFYVSRSEYFMNLFYGSMILFYGIIIAELALVFMLAAKVHKMKASTASSLFLLYAALNGITLSFIFTVYTSSSIASTFFICASTFAVSSIFGMTTKRDLTSFGNFLMMGLFGIIIASVVNIFLQSSGMEIIISLIGVFVFVGLTAYDTQKLKEMALSQPEVLDPDVAKKGAVRGALSLYLDFINLFLMLLHLLGGERD